ncbi:MAG: PH domain-containing protein [Thermoanaerobaculia bacterium]|nr:PH domain-containing protein [Thermoanaerobaculia bacterium]
MDSAVYTMIPPVGKATNALWFIPAILIVVFAVTGFMIAKTIAGARHSTFELSPSGLTLKGDLWGRTIPASHLRGAAVRIVNLQSEPGLALKRRTAGTAVPGYRSGWFKLQNGEKALIYLTATDRVIYLPTTEGFSLLLSVDAPDRFAEHVRRVAPTG